MCSAQTSARATIDVPQGQGLAGEHEQPQVGLDDGVPLFAALTELERTAWMWRHGLVLDPHQVVCQVRDGAQVLVLGRLLDGHPLVQRPPAAAHSRWPPVPSGCWWLGQAR